MSHGSFWERSVRGVQWSWINPRYGGRLPMDFEKSVMAMEPTDRYHAKQGRSTARVVFEPASTARVSIDSRDGAGNDSQTDACRPLSVYLKRHFELPFYSRLGALFWPGGAHSPAACEWAGLRLVAALGVEVPEVVAVGESIGPGLRLTSFLALADLVGLEPLHEALPRLRDSLEPACFERAKSRIIDQVAWMTAAIHRAGVFHKDLYLCHFFLDPTTLEDESERPRLVLIDFHRTRKHRVFREPSRSKDLAQLLFSTDGVAGLGQADCARFWNSYRLSLGLLVPAYHLAFIFLRVRRYRDHERNRRLREALPSRAPHSAIVRVRSDKLVHSFRSADHGARGSS